jgi:hypothetical protein
MGRELFRANGATHTNPAFASTLASNVSASATSLAVATGDGAYLPSPTGGDFFRLRVGTNASNEVVRVTGRTGDTLACDALEASHTAGDDVKWTVSGETLEALRLPDPAGNTGKLLTTNGTDASWAGIETGGLVVTDFCTLTIGSAQSITRDSGLTLLNFDTTNTGNSSFLSAGDKGFKIPVGKAGYYQINFKNGFIWGSGLLNMYAATAVIQKNGVDLNIEDCTFGTGSSNGGNAGCKINVFSPIVYLADNDIITFKASAWSTTNDSDALNIGPEYTLASLIRYQQTQVGNITVEYDYVEKSTDVTVTSTNVAAQTTLISGSSVTYDGNTQVKIEFYCAGIYNSSGLPTLVHLFDGTTDLGKLCDVRTNSAVQYSIPIQGSTKIIPSNGAHTFHIKAWHTTGANSVANFSSANSYIKGFLRITNANPTVNLPIFKPSGTGHAIGIVPDTGATAGVTKFLCEDATWKNIYTYNGNVTYNFGSIANGEQSSTTLTVTGAILGDFVTHISSSIALSGLRLWGEVTATDTVTIYLSNMSGNPVDLSSGTFYVGVSKR